MKKVLFLFTAFVIAIMVAACTFKTQTPAQVAERACPPIQVALISLQALNGLDTNTQTKLADASKIVNAACSATESVDFSSLTKLNKTALPALIEIVKVSPLTPEQQNQVILDLSAGQIILDGVSAVVMPPDASPGPAQTPPAPAPAPAAPADAAPAKQGG